MKHHDSSDIADTLDRIADVIGERPRYVHTAEEFRGYAQAIRHGAPDAKIILMYQRIMDLLRSGMGTMTDDMYAVDANGDYDSERTDRFEADTAVARNYARRKIKRHKLVGFWRESTRHPRG